MGECYQWRANGQCSKGDPCSFSDDRLASGNSGGGRRRKGRSSSPAPKAKAQTDEREVKYTKTSGNKEENSSDKKRAKFHDDTGFVKNRYVNFGTLPCVKTTSQKKGCTHGKKCFFRHFEAEEKPDRRSKKGGAKGKVSLLKESTQLGCTSQDSYPRQSILHEPEDLGSKHAVKFSKGTWHQSEIREKKRPSQGVVRKGAPHERGPCAPKFREPIT